jgi:GNAT superfamily N-acetyltransferase
MKVRMLEKPDIPVIVGGFEKSDWQIKPKSLFENYFEVQQKEHLLCFVTFIEEDFAAYVTLKWQSDYKRFAEERLPEISDLNVLPKFRNRGLGTQLIEKCETAAAQRSEVVEIGVGLYADYGSAQRLYMKRGYIPDGQGITYNYS